jgi:hypothetical protein
MGEPGHISTMFVLSIKSENKRKGFEKTLLGLRARFSLFFVGLIEGSQINAWRKIIDTCPDSLSLSKSLFFAWACRELRGEKQELRALASSCNLSNKNIFRPFRSNLNPVRSFDEISPGIRSTS